MQFSETITSPANPRIKQAARLREAGDRRATGTTLVDGLRELSRAAAAGIDVDMVFVEADEEGSLTARRAAARQAAIEACVEACRRQGAEVLGVAPRAFERIAFGDRNEGVVGVVRFAARHLADVSFATDRPVLVAEGVEKPGNLGAILRTADAAGLGGVIVSDPRTDPANPATIRASLGTVFSVPLAVAPTEEAIRWCRDHGRRVVVATPEAEQDWFAADLTGTVAIVVGSEAEGVSPAWRVAAAAGEIAIESAKLPMRGLADSLNVSVTAAVLAYESLRQARARGSDA